MGASGLILANLLYLVLGVGLLGLFGSARSWGELGVRAGLGYMAGVATAGIIGAELALVGVPLGLPGLAVVAVPVAAAGGGRFLRRVASARGPRSPHAGFWGGRVVAGATLVQSVLLVGVAGSAFAVVPFTDWDSWAIWGIRARALLAFGGAANPVFLSSTYAQHNQDYPLLLPSLEATGYRAIGAVDTSLMHLQLLALAVGFAAALWGLLRPRVPAEIAGLCILAVLAAQGPLVALASGYADAPLAFFVALGIVALGRWLMEPESGLLPWAALFMAAGALTKNEGALFAAAAVLPALAIVLARERHRALGLLIAGVVIFLPLVPWRIFVAIHHLHDPAINPGDLTAGSLAAQVGRLGPAADALLRELADGRFGLLVPLVLAGLVAAALAGAARLALFGAGWLVLSFGGLLVPYWASHRSLDWYLATSANRVVLTLVVGGVALATLGAGEAWSGVLADWRARTFARRGPTVDSAPGSTHRVRTGA